MFESHFMVLALCTHRGHSDQAGLYQHNIVVEVWILKILQRPMYEVNCPWNKMRWDGTFKRWGRQEEVSPLEGCPSRGHWDPQPLTHLIFLSFPAIMRWKGVFYHTLHHDTFCCYRLKQQWSVHEMRPYKPKFHKSETATQGKSFFLIGWLFQTWCHSNGKMTNPCSCKLEEEFCVEIFNGQWHESRFAVGICQDDN